MVHFVGAGSGATDLITLRGAKHLQEADIVIYAGSLINKELLSMCNEACLKYDSATMTLEDVINVISNGEKNGLKIVRLHTGDPCIYGAIREQMDILDTLNIEYDYTPGVSSFCGAAAALNLEYTLPNVSQSVIITRMAGKTSVPDSESIEGFASHNATMVIFLSTGMLDELSKRLIVGGYRKDTPAAIVYKASWPDEKKFICTVDTLVETAKANNISKTALIIVGDVISHSNYERSKLYDPTFETGFRMADKPINCNN